MSELPRGGRSAEIDRALELLKDPNICWHPTMGFDLGALIINAQLGIKPEIQFSNHPAVMALAISPADTSTAEHVFFANHVPYSISFPLKRPLPSVAYSDPLYYQGTVPKIEMLGVMIPEAYADSPIADLPSAHPYKKIQIRPWLERQADGYESLLIGLGSAFADDIEAIESDYLRDKNYNNLTQRKKAAKAINGLVMSKYQMAFGQLLWLEQPTLKEAVSYIARRNDLDLLILPCDFRA